MSSQPPRRDDDLSDVFGALEREFQRPAAPEERPRAVAPRPPVRPPAPRRSLVPTVRVVTVLLVINVLMYVLTVVLAQRIGDDNALYVLGAKDNRAIDQGEWWRLLTPMVLHGGLLHLLFNSYALYALGTGVEAAFGARRFLAIYLVSGLAGSMASYLFNPQALSVGASGAIFGLLGALGARIYMARNVMGREATKMQFGQIGSMIAINLIFGFSVPNIDNAAHIGGLLVGALVGLVLAPRYRVVQTYGGVPQARRTDERSAWPLVAGIAVALVVGFAVLRMFM